MKKDCPGEDIIRLPKVVGLGCLVVLLLVGIPVLSGESTKGATPDSAGGRDLQDKHLDKSAPRMAGDMVYERQGMKFDCMECHRSLKAKWHLPAQLMEHRDLELNHGSNRFCLNCHHPENRNVYVDYDGAEIPETSVVLLCGKCHGPQHRDWLIGAHGRKNGYWDKSLGESELLSCIQCHDPHDPEFKPMKPMAAPTYPARAAGGGKKGRGTGDHE